MKYVATMNVPGYLPWSDDEPPVFDTAGEAWAYLAERRREQEDDAFNAEDLAGGEPYSNTADTLEMCAVNGGDGTVYGSNPGLFESPSDLGIAYCVTEVDE